jgi:hypothetical protein
MAKRKHCLTLMQLGSTEDVETRREVAAAFRNISLSEACKVMLVHCGALGVLCDMMHSADVEVCHQSTGVIANLAEATENQPIMVENDIIQHLKYVGRAKSKTKFITNSSNLNFYAP